MILTRLRRLFPGVLLLVVVGLSAKGIASSIPMVSHLIVAVAIGVIITNTIGTPSILQPGINLYNLLLETGIVLMGATLALDALIEVGPTLLILVLAVASMTILVVEIVSRSLFGLDDKLGSLLAAGASICGVSAVVTVAGGIRAKEKHIAFAVAVILVFDAVTLFSYPLIAKILTLSDTVFGIWAGLTMFSTGPVVAAGFEHSPKAGQLATITKLTRNLLISLIAIIYSMYYVRGTISEDGSENRPSLYNNLSMLWENFPKFLFGFILIMLIANTGLLSESQIQSAENTYQWLFLFAFAGLGLEIQLDEMVQTGKAPLLMVFVTFIFMSSITLVALLWIFP